MHNWCLGRTSCASRKPPAQDGVVICARPLWVYPTGVGGSPTAPLTLFQAYGSPRFYATISFPDYIIVIVTLPLFSLLTLQNGWLEIASRSPSPNCDERPPDTPIELIVLHNISLPPCEFGGPWIDALFTNQLDPDAHPYFQDIYQLRVSAHVLIRRDGELMQYVPFHQRAWHAGVSCYKGRERCNDFSIGIELEGADTIPYEDTQYQKLAQLIQSLWWEYPSIPADAITGHSDIAPGRKTDPGPAFDWDKLQFLLHSAPNNSST